MNLDFELILFYAIVITGVLSLIDVVWLAKRRKRYSYGSITETPKPPLLFEYARSFFPILVIVFLLRSFLFEPFRIPSGSLEPTLLTGDFIFVNKFNYGTRLPILHTKLFGKGEPARGDIMVFLWPPDPSYKFIKRVIGLPGDRISYIDKELYVNGEKIPQNDLSSGIASLPSIAHGSVIEKQENFFGVKHNIFVMPDRESRNYSDVTVPLGMYFVMGDNRDDSADSRYWGFVPEKNIVGKASRVWMSWNNDKWSIRWRRIGQHIQ
ncbi:MAG: signal peptidase I [Gammaproteobacteria bacterium]|nr:signal peptidase I [Gammaproteobacteria bacterium]